MPRAERERQILAVAGTVFARGDYRSASMDAIAERAGVSKPMLYAYFGSKDGLYAAYLGTMGTVLLDRLVGAGAEGDPPDARLRVRVDEFLAFVEENRDGWRVLFREITGGVVAAEVASLRSQVAGGISQLVVEGLRGRADEVPGIAVEAASVAIVGAGESVANWWLEREALPRATVCDWLVGMIDAVVVSLLQSSGT